MILSLLYVFIFFVTLLQVCKSVPILVSLLNDFICFISSFSSPFSFPFSFFFPFSFPPLFQRRCGKLNPNIYSLAERYRLYEREFLKGDNKVNGKHPCFAVFFGVKNWEVPETMLLEPKNTVKISEYKRSETPGFWTKKRKGLFFGEKDNGECNKEMVVRKSNHLGKSLVLDEIQDEVLKCALCQGGYEFKGYCSGKVMGSLMDPSEVLKRVISGRNIYLVRKKDVKCLKLSKDYSMLDLRFFTLPLMILIIYSGFKATTLLAYTIVLLLSEILDSELNSHLSRTAMNFISYIKVRVSKIEKDTLRRSISKYLEGFGPSWFYCDREWGSLRTIDSPIIINTPGIYDQEELTELSIGDLYEEVKGLCKDNNFAVLGWGGIGPGNQNNFNIESALEKFRPKSYIETKREVINPCEEKSVSKIVKVISTYKCGMLSVLSQEFLLIQKLKFKFNKESTRADSVFDNAEMSYSLLSVRDKIKMKVSSIKLPHHNEYFNFKRFLYRCIKHTENIHCFNYSIDKSCHLPSDIERGFFESSKLVVVRKKGEIYVSGDVRGEVVLNMLLDKLMALKGIGGNDFKSCLKEYCIIMSEVCEEKNVEDKVKEGNEKIGGEEKEVVRTTTSGDIISSIFKILVNGSASTKCRLKNSLKRRICSDLKVIVEELLVGFKLNISNPLKASKMVKEILNKYSGCSKVIMKGECSESSAGVEEVDLKVNRVDKTKMSKAEIREERKRMGKERKALGKMEADLQKGKIRVELEKTKESDSIGKLMKEIKDMRCERNVNKDVADFLERESESNDGVNYKFLLNGRCEVMESYKSKLISNLNEKDNTKTYSFPKIKINTMITPKKANGDCSTKYLSKSEVSYLYNNTTYNYLEDTIERREEFNKVQSIKNEKKREGKMKVLRRLEEIRLKAKESSELDRGVTVSLVPDQIEIRNFFAPLYFYSTEEINKDIETAVETEAKGVLNCMIMKRIDGAFSRKRRGGGGEVKKKRETEIKIKPEKNRVGTQPKVKSIIKCRNLAEYNSAVLDNNFFKSVKEKNIETVVGFYKRPHSKVIAELINFENYVNNELEATNLSEFSQMNDLLKRRNKLAKKYNFRGDYLISAAVSCKKMVYKFLLKVLKGEDIDLKDINLKDCGYKEMNEMFRRHFEMQLDKKRKILNEASKNGIANPPIHYDYPIGFNKCERIGYKQILGSESPRNVVKDIEKFFIVMLGIKLGAGGSKTLKENESIIKSVEREVKQRGFLSD